jgi:hypothetical protein
MPASKGKIHAARHRQGLSGLQGKRRINARRLSRKAAMTAIKQAPMIHYTQNYYKRWEGIRNKDNPFRGECPANADCSSSTTWILWAVLVHHYGFKRDNVNDAAWKEGYTGTQVENGVRVKHKVNWRIGDLIFYGDQGGGVPKHVVKYMGGGMVFSHGSEGGPYLLPWNYRADYNQTRRYI